VSFHPHYVNIKDAAQAHGVAVVIDVLRAFTTAAWAFALGAERIILSDETDQALAVKARIPGALALKDATPLPGFELSNSPVELLGRDLSGVTIVQRTTAGTVGAVAARSADRLYCASFVNASATADAILNAGTGEAYFVVTGEGGAADEDQACAEYIAALVAHTSCGPTHPAEAGVDPAPFLERVAASNAARLMAQRVAEGTPGVHPRDVEAAMEADRFNFVMRAREERLPGIGSLLVLRRHDRA
jgi:2-phosphosulfolactate phosphatase